MTTDVKALVERLRWWTQNEEMVDSYFTEHGKDCEAAADALARQERENETLREALRKLRDWADRAHDALEYNAPNHPCVDEYHEVRALTYRDQPGGAM